MRYYFERCLSGLRIAIKIISDFRRASGRDWNWVPPRNKSENILLEPSFSIMMMKQNRAQHCVTISHKPAVFKPERKQTGPKYKKKKKNTVSHVCVNCCCTHLVLSTKSERKLLVCFVHICWVRAVSGFPLQELIRAL